MEPEALIFDCDGTLLDTMPMWWPSWVATCAEFGLKKFTMARFYALAGVPVPEILRIAAAEEDPPVPLDVEAALAFKKAFHLAAVADGTLGHPPRIAPVCAIVEAAHKAGTPLAVASSGTKAMVEGHLREAGMLGYFGAVVTTEDIVNQKPAPDIYLEAARRLGVEPAKCRAFEDADVGMESIRAAGMEAVDVRLMEGYPNPSMPAGVCVTAASPS